MPKGGLKMPLSPSFRPLTKVLPTQVEPHDASI